MLFDTVEKLKNALESMKAEAFVEHALFDRVPQLFENRIQYVSWKRDLAGGLEVDPACITVVGTAALGWSLNPNKNFKPFDDESDVDVAIISPYHFAIAWRYLRSNPDRRLSVDWKTRNAWNMHATNYIYWGTVATDRLLGVLPFGDRWLKVSSQVSLVKPTENRDVKFRIYNDFESLRSYQVLSATKGREQILGANKDA